MKYFTADELKCKGSGIVSLAEGFGAKLDALREAYGLPMTINSACRSFKHNKAIGGHHNSAHIYDHPERSFRGTYAVDIHCVDATLRAHLAKTALNLGWSVGINKTFLHLDRRTDYTKLPQAIFLY